MFCQKCGKELIEGAVFCNSCGNPVQAQGDTPNVTNAESTISQENITNTNTVVRRSKSWYKKWWIWAIAVVAIIVILSIIGGGETGVNVIETDDSGSLSQTYTNEAEGISFKYQDSWKMMSDTSLNKSFNELDGFDYLEPENAIIAFFENGQKSQENYAALMIMKSPSNKDGIDAFFSMTESEAALAYSVKGISLDNLSDISLDGVPARMMISTIDNNTLRMYYYAVGNTMYMVQFIYSTSQAESPGKIFDAIMNSYKITAPKNLYPDEILYNGVPISQIFQTQAQDIRSFLGEPTHIEDGEDAVYYYGAIAGGEESQVCLSYNQDGHLNEITAYGLDKFSYNGTSLSGKTHAGLTEILGEPDAESDPASSRGEYFMNWQYSDYTVDMLMQSSNPEEIPFAATFTNKNWISDPAVNTNMIDENFEWVEQPNVQSSEYSSYIVGVIRNTTEKNFSYIEIRFKLYDSAGNQVGIANDSIRSLAGGNTWKFGAYPIDNSAARYEFDGITAY